MPDKPPPDFPGFDVPEANWFKMPNNWTDISASINSLAELKIVEYILKHTWGYQEYGVLKRITTDEFMHGRKRTDGTRIDSGTGLSDEGVRQGIKRALADRLIEEDVDDHDKARIKKSYAIRMRANDVGSDPKTFGPKEIGPDPNDVGPRSQRRRDRTEKESKERTGIDTSNQYGMTPREIANLEHFRRFNEAQRIALEMQGYPLPPED